MAPSRRSERRARPAAIAVAVGVAALFALGASSRAGEPKLGPIVSYGEAVRTATIAVSPKGRVSLAVATKGGVELVDLTKAAGPQRRWSVGAPFAAGGEDRPQVGFSGANPGILALRANGEIALFFPEQSEAIPLVAAAKHRECLASVMAGKSIVAGWTQEGALHLLTMRGKNVEVVVDPRVCPCCRPGVADLGDGAALIAYREEHEDDTRDIYLVRKLPKSAELRPAVRVSTEGWKARMCPMQGPAVIAPSEKTVVVAYVVPNDVPELKVAVSVDGGETFAPAVKIANGTKPQLVKVSGGRVALAYDGAAAGSEDGREHVFVAVTEDATMKFGNPKQVDESKAGTGEAPGGVALAAAPDGKSAWVSWVEKNGEKRAVAAREVRLDD